METVFCLVISFSSSILNHSHFFIIFVSENYISMSTLEAFHIYTLEKKITLGINFKIFEMMRHIKYLLVFRKILDSQKNCQVGTEGFHIYPREFPLSVTPHIYL